MHNVTIAIVGPPCSGKSTLTIQLNSQVVKRPTDGRLFHLNVVNIGQCYSPETSHAFDFAIFTFDLTAPEDSKAARENAYTSFCESKDNNPQMNACLVGTKMDLIPQTPYDIALATHGPRRSLNLSSPFLKIFAVSAITGMGCTELLLHIANIIKPIEYALSRSLFRAIETLQTWVADQFAALLALPVPENVNRATPDSGKMSDEIITGLLKTPEARKWDEAFEEAAPGSMSTCHKITSDLVVKSAGWDPIEYDNMEYVRSHTRIPVPQPRYHHLKSTWLVMDYIKGSMLHVCWESQSLWMKIRIACTLRGYIKQLRNLRSTRPGSLNDGLIHDNELFDSHRCGPFASSTGLRVYCEQIAHSGWLRFVH
ncbi:hypothetical protein C8Q75DRAFT_385446 [Abortiporus biennis]|nr:hypothetical protein C8Q75DRAFT_385446 [Abortiporus biennis]